MLPKSIKDVPTPCFLVDIDKVKRNAQRMKETCDKFQVHLRPHMKTHKTIEAALIMTGGSKRKIVVSTLAEARFYADNGFDDILYGFPFTADKRDRCKQLTNELEEFHLLVDSQEGLHCIMNFPLNPGKKWSCFLDVDCGHGRTGVEWDSELAVNIAQKMEKSEEIQFQGLYAHCGNSYKISGGPGFIQAIGAETTERLTALVQKLKECGVNCKTVGTGSTPCCSQPSVKMASLTEFHPGNYIFNDFMQTLIGSCQVGDIACCVATRVVGHKPSQHQIVVDCGFLGISHDGFYEHLSSGPCLFKDHPNLRLTGVTQELGKVKAIKGEIDYSKYPIGSILFIYPFHSCATAAMHQVYFVHSGEKVVGVWKPTRGW